MEPLEVADFTLASLPMLVDWRASVVLCGTRDSEGRRMGVVTVGGVANSEKTNIGENKHR